MLNWHGVRTNAGNRWLPPFILGPGFVQTDLGNKAAVSRVVKMAVVPIDESVNGLVNVLTNATKQKYGEKIVLYTGLQAIVFDLSTTESVTVRHVLQ